MKLSNAYFYTLREDVKDEESKSGNLLVRAGYITKMGSGIYTFLPLGLKTLKNIENIIRDEMDKAGASEVLMPSLIPMEYYEASERASKFGDAMFKLSDRYKRSYALGPTHEELFTTVAKLKVKSYKDLPFSLYQMANKYRDEARPRYGLIRVREFIMKDAYSFDKDEEGLDVSYQAMFKAYCNIMDRCGLDYKIVSSDCGAMGGSLSEEFQAICDIGEDTICFCPKCNYSTNLEVGINLPNKYVKEDKKPMESVYTPEVKTIEDVAKFLDVDIKRLVKTLIYSVDGALYAVLVPGEYEVNITKLSNFLDATDVRLATQEEVESIGSIIGFAGPVGLDIPIIIDEDIKNMTNFVVGKNEVDHHLINVNVDDFKYSSCIDVKMIKEGDLCPHCGEKLLFTKGIEVGNTFKLGTKYSEALDLRYLDEQNNLRPVVMGCYGIGVARIMASIAEQRGCAQGLNWPINIAPYQVYIIIANMKDEEQVTIANKLYETLPYECILDDRNERIGVKFNDADLLGIPIKIVVGRSIVDENLEVKYDGNTELVSIDCIESYLKNIIE